MLLVVFLILFFVFVGSFFYEKEKQRRESDKKNEELKYLKKRGEIIEERRLVIAKAKEAYFEEIAKNNKNEEVKIDDFDFQNKSCRKLEDFIINDRISEYDIVKLAELNGITQLAISNGWYPLLIEMVNELNKIGWDKKVTGIKEKYGSLRVSTSQNTKKINKILDYYKGKSTEVCETCGKTGKIRTIRNWDFVACRQHYLEMRGVLIFDDKGFIYFNQHYNFDDIKRAQFHSVSNNEIKSIILDFKEDVFSQQLSPSNSISIDSSIIGYALFLKKLCKINLALDTIYLKNFEIAEFCEICGFKSVFLNTCECCEQYTWDIYKKKWEEISLDIEEEKIEYLKREQISWFYEEREYCRLEQNHYVKNPNYKIYFSENEYEEFKKFKLKYS